MPNVATTQEAGPPGFEFTGHHAIQAPPAVSPEMHERFYRAVQAAITVPQTVHRLRKLGADITDLCAGVFATFSENEDAL